MALDHRIPAVALFEIATGGVIGIVLRCLLETFVERIQRGKEVLVLGHRKSGVKAALAPWGWCLVDFEAELACDRNEGVPVGRMQPAATEIEDNAGGGGNGVGASADPVAGFEHDDGEAGVFNASAAPSPAAPAPIMATSILEGRFRDIATLITVSAVSP